VSCEDDVGGRLVALNMEAYPLGHNVIQCFRTIHKAAMGNNIPALEPLAFSVSATADVR